MRIGWRTDKVNGECLTTKRFVCHPPNRVWYFFKSMSIKRKRSHINNGIERYRKYSRFGIEVYLCVWYGITDKQTWPMPNAKQVRMHISMVIFSILLYIWWFCFCTNSLTSNEIAARYRFHIFSINFVWFNIEFRACVDEAKNVFLGKIFGDAHFCHLINS